MEKEKGENRIKHLKIFFGVLIAIDIFLWKIILFPANASDLELYFLDVGQGDSSLAILPGGIKVLIDGGPMNGRAQQELEKILPLQDRYIDLIMVSHPQLDHFGGLLDIMRNYRIGAVLTSGFGSESQYWKEFEKMRIENKIPKVEIAQGDQIIYGDSRFIILWPGHINQMKDLNEVAIGTILESNGMRAFFGGDLGREQEDDLARLYDVNVDILKVSHHGSKFSSDSGFLKEASPLFSIIEVGKNSYGHPTKEALARLASVNSQIYRTDRDGLVKFVVDKGSLKSFTSK